MENRGCLSECAPNGETYTVAGVTVVWRYDEQLATPRLVVKADASTARWWLAMVSVDASIIVGAFPRKQSSWAQLLAFPSPITTNNTAGTVVTRMVTDVKNERQRRDTEV